ncbi:MAG: UV-endonuclease UvdE [Anaerocolumna sp.]|jgi:UV DNA damage endonuclease|nr:UV-endonuclease UvdE [Anaerocolumna sp.]
MSIGYACQTIGIPNTSSKNCTLKNANEEKLYQIISYNLDSLDHILNYNINNGIKLFRISSDLIPFASSPANTLEWWNLFQAKFIELGDKIKKHNIRVSMHPGQYTVLNSPNTDVVYRAIKDLEYHNRVLDSLKVGKNHKLVLHIGGIYNDKEQAMLRFITNFKTLDQRIKDRLVLENDDKLYNIKDVMEIASQTNSPVIFDNLHHKINPCNDLRDEFSWIQECKCTWEQEDGNQKMHYSEQNPLKRLGSHSNTINAEVFFNFYNNINREDIDIMLEVKDKNLSAVKCINAVSKEKSIKNLELEWSKYKYLVLEKSHEDYNSIRKLLKEKDNYPVIPFYNYIDHAMEKESAVGGSVNAAQHVWGYFKECATEKEKKLFESKLSSYTEGKISLLPVKKLLWQLTNQYQQNYLLDSYYFADVIETI